MNRTLAALALSAMTLTSVTVAAPASARDHHRGYDRDERVYRGHDGRYRGGCRSGNGAVGTIAGGAGGALIGNGLGGGTLGTVAGGVGGALLGRHLDKQHTRHRNGC